MLEDEATLPRADSDAEHTVSVVVCAYTDRRWTLLCEAIESLLAQRRPVDEVVLVIDHDDELLARAAARFTGIRVLANEDQQGLAGARNTGVRHSRGSIVAFLDDDATAAENWLQTLLEVFRDPLVLGAGGPADAVWEGPEPPWLPPEFLWVVGASYRGLPQDVAPIRNPIGANMAFRREAFERAGNFTDGIGRTGKTPLGCEETEFSIRVRQAIPGAIVLHVPGARVAHHVSTDRGTWDYFASRCWAEGVSKALVIALVGREDGLSSERTYVTRTLPLGVLSGIRAAARGDRYGLARSGAVVAGLAITTAGFVRGWVAGKRSSRKRA